MSLPSGFSGLGTEESSHALSPREAAPTARHTVRMELPEGFSSAPPETSQQQRSHFTARDIVEADIWHALDHLADIKAAMTEAGRHTHGELDEDTFVAALQPILGLSERKLRRWFMRIDFNCSNSTSFDELSTYLATVEKKQSNARQKEFVPLDAWKGIPTSAYHKVGVNSVLCHGGGFIATGSYDGVVKVWNSETLRLQAETRTAMSSTMCLLQPDQKLAVASINRIIDIYQVPSLSLVRRYVGHKASVPGGHAQTTQARKMEVQMPELVDSPSCMECIDHEGSSLLFLGMHTGAMQLYRMSSELPPAGPNGLRSVAPDARMSFHSDCVTQIRSCRELAAVLSSSWDKKLQLFDPATQRIIRTLQATRREQSRSIFSFAWSDSMKVIAACGGDRGVQLWNPWMPDPILSLHGHNANVVACAFNDTDEQLISLSVDNTVVVWDMRTYKIFQQWTDTTSSALRSAHHIDDGHVSALTFDESHGRLVLASTFPQTHCVFRHMTNFVQGYSGHTEPVLAALYNTTFNQIITVDQATAHIWHPDTGEKVASFAMSDHCTTCGWDGHQRRLLVGSATGQFHTMNYLNGQPLKIFEQMEDPPGEICAMGYASVSLRELQGDRDLRYFYAASGNRIGVWADSESFHEKRHCEISMGSELASVMLPCPPSHLAVGTHTGSIRMYHVSSNKCTTQFRLRPKALAQFSPRSSVARRMTSVKYEGGEDDSDVEDKPEVAFLEGEAVVKEIEAMVLLEAHELLVSVMRDRSLHFWDVNPKYHTADRHYGFRIGQTPFSGGGMFRLCHGPKTGVLVAADDDGALHVVDISQLRRSGGEDTIVRPDSLRWVCSFATHSSRISSLDFLDARRLILCSSLDCTVRLYGLSGCCVGQFGQATTWSLDDPSTWEDRSTACPPSRAFEMEDEIFPEDLLPQLEALPSPRMLAARRNTLGVYLATASSSKDVDIDEVSE
eukprot:RCo027171